jgi:hypothetical protein
VIRPQALFATPQAKISDGYPLTCNIFLPLSDNTGATSMCGNTGPLYATSNQICTTPLRDETPGSLCAPHSSPENPVTRVVAAHMLMENKAVLIQDPNLNLRDATTTVLNISFPPLKPLIQYVLGCCWDPGRQNGLHLLLLHPTFLRRDATTTELNIRVPLPPLNPSASMRARQDEDNDKALDRPSIDTSGWDPGKDDAEAGLSACETVFACPDYDLLLLHPTLLRRDATTTALNIGVPLPPLYPSASMRARQDEDNDDAPVRPSIDTCGWDPGKDEATVCLTACETVFACPACNYDGSTFADDFDVAGEISGSGSTTPTGTTTTPTRVRWLVVYILV